MIKNMEKKILSRVLAPIFLAGALYSAGCANTHTNYLLGIPLVSDPAKREELMNKRDAELVRKQEYQRRNESSIRPIDGNTQGLNLFQYKP